jgi:hypothetical protein
VSGPSRPRVKRRQDERTLRKRVRRVEGVADRLPGGSPQYPIDVTSAVVVEGRARGARCVQCGGDYEVRGDRASSTGRGVLREMELVCRRCHAPRTLWFRVAVTAPS